MSDSRKIAAIVFTDIIGYTALVGEDEQKAFDVLRRNRQLQQPDIKQFNGVWIKELRLGFSMSHHIISTWRRNKVKTKESKCGKFVVQILPK